MSSLFRLSLAAVVVFVFILLTGFFSTLNKTVHYIQQEEVSNYELAQEMVDAQLKLLDTYPYIEVRPEKLSALFHLSQFSDSNYLTIKLFNNDDELIASNKALTQQDTVLPSVLRHILEHPFEAVQRIERDVSFGTMKLGKIVIEPDRDAELQDVWSEILSNLLPVMMVFLIVLVGVILVVNFIINPVLEFIRTVQRQGAAQPVVAGTRLARLHHLFGLSEHLKGISYQIHDSSQKVEHLHQKILHLQEEERRRLSAELHDELGQHLTAIRFESAAIKSARDLNETQQSAEAIDSIGREMRDIIRSMLARLRPPELESMGMQGALKEMISEWQMRHPENTVAFVWDAASFDLDDDEKLSLYRIVQEGLTNISRHAGEQTLNVDISLQQKEGLLTLIVKDDGIGCDLTKPVKGFGLKGMRERTEEMSGKLQLKSEPGKGMEVIVQLPIGKRKNNESN